jgi:hypothetical protein
MKHFDRVAMEGYLPTNEDIGNMRTAYRCGISEHVFDFKDLALRLFNVGSNNSIGRRWWHVFDNVQVLIYVIPLDEYDQILPEMIEGGGVSIKQLSKRIQTRTDQCRTTCAQK